MYFFQSVLFKIYPLWTLQAGILSFLCFYNALHAVGSSHYHAVNYLMMLQAVVSSWNVIVKPLMAMILFTMVPHYYQLSCYSSKVLEHYLKWLRLILCHSECSQLIKFFGRQENSAHLVDLADAATKVLMTSNNDCLNEDYL